MKKWLTLSLTVLLLLQLSYGEAQPYAAAERQLDVFAITAQKEAIDRMALQEAVHTKNSIEQGMKLIKRYDLAQSKKEELDMTINAATIIEKTRLGNDIKALGYIVERNATMLGARQLYMATLSAKLTLELEQLKLNHAEAEVQRQEVRRQTGVITQNALEQSKRTRDSQRVEAALAAREYQAYYQKLVEMFNGDVVIAAEAARSTALQPLDYYLQFVDNRLEVKAPLLQDQMIALDLPFYDNRFYLRNDEVLDSYQTLLRDSRQFQLDSEMARLQVTKDIEAAYYDIKAALSQLAATELRLSQLKARYQQMQALVKQGMMTQSQLDELAINIKQLDNGYKLAAFSLNTKRRQLQMAGSAGPAYQ